VHFSCAWTSRQPFGDALIPHRRLREQQERISFAEPDGMGVGLCFLGVAVTRWMASDG
jgi:hypothetical protein